MHIQRHKQRLFFERAIATSGATPRRVITDKAAT